MGQNFTRIENVFLLDCQKHVSHLDDLLVGLASSVDSVHSALNILLRDLDSIAFNKEVGDGFVNTNADLQEKIQMTNDLLFNVKGTLTNEKMAVLEGVSLLKRHLQSKAASKLLTAVPALKNEKIEDYIRIYREREHQRLNGRETRYGHEEADDGKDKVIQELKSSIESLKSEIVTHQKTEVEMNEKLQNLSLCNAEMENNLTALRTQPKLLEMIPVQLYYHQRSEQMGNLIQDIMSILGKQDKFAFRKLAFIKCDDATEIQPGLPLLALCINTSRLGTDASLAIQGIQQLKNTVLVIFHHKDEHALPSQNSDRVLTDPEFKAIGKITDIAFLSDKGIYECEKNKLAVDGLVAFIEEYLGMGN